MSWTEVVAHLFDADSGRKVGYALLQLVCARSLVGKDELNDAFWELDAIDDDAADMGVLVLRACANAPQLLSDELAVAHFVQLEMLPKASPGLGLRLGARLMRYMTRRWLVCAFLLKPFALQYRFEQHPATAGVVEQARTEFERATQRLVHAYQRRWGAVSVPRFPEWLMCSVPPYEVRATREHWRVDLSPIVAGS
jgi:hypothetical protein